MYNNIFYDVILNHIPITHKYSWIKEKISYSLLKKN